MLKTQLKISWRFLIPVLLVLFFLSLLSSRTKRAPWYEQWAWNVVSPVTSVFSWTAGKLSQIGHHYFFLVGTVKENEQLQKELKGLKQTLVTFEETVFENKRLSSLLDLKQTLWPQAVAARVIAYDPRSEFKSIRINKGAVEGVAPDMPVVAAGGLVGKVGPVFSHDAIVLLIVDPASTVDVMILRSRVRSLLVGTEKKTELKPVYFLTRLEYLKRQSDIQVGDEIVTSGLDQLFPKGIAVGQVDAIENNHYGIFESASVIPAVDFTQLEEVMVLKGPGTVDHGPGTVD